MGPHEPCYQGKYSLHNATSRSGLCVWWHYTHLDLFDNKALRLCDQGPISISWSLEAWWLAVVNYHAIYICHSNPSKTPVKCQSDQIILITSHGAARLMQDFTIGRLIERNISLISFSNAHLLRLSACCCQCRNTIMYPYYAMASWAVYT